MSNFPYSDAFANFQEALTVYEAEAKKMQTVLNTITGDQDIKGKREKARQKTHQARVNVIKLYNDILTKLQIQRKNHWHFCPKCNEKTIGPCECIGNPIVDPEPCAGCKIMASIRTPRAYNQLIDEARTKARLQENWADGLCKLRDGYAIEIGPGYMDWEEI